MAYALKKLKGVPIILLTIDLPLERHMENARSLQSQVSRWARETHGPLYIILDAGALDLSWSDVLLWLGDQRLQRGSPLVFSNVHLLVAGTDPMVCLGIKKIQQQLGFTILRFDTTADAVASALRALSDADPGLALSS